MKMSWDKVEDWKELLAHDSKQILADLIESTRDHRGAFIQADDVKVAQLWTALVEMKKEINQLKEVLEKVGMPFKTFVEMGDVEKRKTIERIIRETLKPEPDKEEATQKLIESLMKF